MPIRLVLADDHYLVREGVRRLLETDPDLEVERHFEQALQLNASIGARPWLARTQCDYAGMLLARDSPGDRERAQELLDAALATYRELGMDSYAASASALAQDATVSTR